MLCHPRAAPRIISWLLVSVGSKEEPQAWHQHAAEETTRAHQGSGRSKEESFSGFFDRCRSLVFSPLFSRKVLLPLLRLYTLCTCWMVVTLLSFTRLHSAFAVESLFFFLPILFSSTVTSFVTHKLYSLTCVYCFASFLSYCLYSFY